MGEHVDFGPLGLCELVPHSMDEEPDRPAAGYVELDTNPGVRDLAFNLEGEWVDRNFRPLKGKPLRWFSIRRLKDGRTI